MKSNNTLIIVVLTILIGLMFVVMHVQQNKINDYKNRLEMTDTTKLKISVDTLYLEKEIKDSVPQTITETIFKIDTVYKKEGDSIEATPMLITLKKKKSPTQL